MQEWVERATTELPDIAAAAKSDGPLRQSLVKAWLLLGAASGEVRRAAKLIADSDIEKVRAELAGALSYQKKLKSLLKPNAGNSKSVITTALAFTRVLDDEAFARCLGQAITDPSMQCRVTLEDGERALVVPFPMLRRAPPIVMGPNTPMSVRAIRRHRIFPDKLRDGTRVRLAALPGPDGRIVPGATLNPIRLGAGLFPGLELDFVKAGAGFLITGIKAEAKQAHADELTKHLANGVGGDREVLLFPELTIDVDARLQISDHLTAIAASGAKSMPLFVIAGSWHDNVADKHINVAPIYNGAGSLITNHKKLAPFNWKGVGAEDIEVGDEIVCVVTRRGIFAVGICLDFCDCAEDSPYVELDVDAALIVSMGDETTMEGHAARAKELYIRRRAGTFVVQQPEPGPPREDGAVGYALRVEGPELAKIDETRVRSAWMDWH